MLQPKDKDWPNRYKKKKKKDPYICRVKETDLKLRETYRLKVKGWEKIFYVNGGQRKAGISILISDKIDFETKTVIRDKEGYYIMIRGSNQDKDITTINIFECMCGYVTCYLKSQQKRIYHYQPSRSKNTSNVGVGRLCGSEKKTDLE